jgi:hypothetical protein
MNVKMLVAATISSLLLASVTNAATSAKLVDDMASGSMSGTNNSMGDNMGAMSGTNAIGDSAMNDSTNTMGNNGMSGSNSMNNSTDGSADTATGDNDY